MSALFAGIDPGVGGAIGFVDQHGAFAGTHDMPVTLATTGRRQIDPAGLAAILRDTCPDFALVERVGPRPGEGAVGAFAFGQTFGIILGVLAALQIPHDVIQPAVWKRETGIPPKADKRASIAAALRLLPGAAPYLKRQKDDGRAEALLLALQAWQRRAGPSTRPPTRVMRTASAR